MAQIKFSNIFFRACGKSEIKRKMGTQNTDATSLRKPSQVKKEETDRL